MLQPFSTTGIGSLPLLDPEEACRLTLTSFDIPFWPQLPKRSFREFMVPQYSEGMPFLKIDGEKQTIWLEKNGSDELERFYESCTEESRIAMSEDFAAGLHAFLRIMRNRTLPCIKGHVTGPLTFTLSLKEVSGKPVYYNEEMREISLMLLKAKVRWQMDILKPLADEVIIFIDEPILSALGTSAYLGVNSDEAFRMLQECIAAVRSSGGISGIHCCGNADWPFVFRLGADIVNFDAYDYLDAISLFPEEIQGFLENGGYLAWGIIPTSDAIGQEDPSSMKDRFDRGFAKISSGIDAGLLRSRSLLTPSCGTGSRTVGEMQKIFQLLMRLKEDLV